MRIVANIYAIVSLTLKYFLLSLSIFIFAFLLYYAKVIPNFIDSYYLLFF